MPENRIGIHESAAPALPPSGQLFAPEPSTHRFMDPNKIQASGERTAEVLEMLQQGVEAITTDAGFKAWLDMQGSSTGTASTTRS